MLAFCSVSLSCKRSRLGSCLTKGTARSLASRGSKESYVVLNHFSAGVELAMTVWASNTTRWADCRLEFHSAVQKALKDVLLIHTRASFPTGAVFRAILPAHSNSFCRFFIGSDPTFIFKPLISSFRFVLGAQ